MLKRIIILFVLFCLHPYNVQSEEAFHLEAIIFNQSGDFFFHTVERGQTVYSIATMYKVAVDDIYRLNPDSKEGIQTGSRLKIPQESGSFYYHTIQPKETLYSVSKLYGMKGEDILSVNSGLSIQTFTIGKIIRIPTNRVTTLLEGRNEEQEKKVTNALLSQSTATERISTIKVALLLPFGLKEGTTVDNSASNRMVEYYEGFLMALYDLKKKGISVSLKVYDIGEKTDGIPAILKKEEMQGLHLIIGGLTDKQIKLIAGFAKEKSIPYVIPFTSKSDEPLNNPFVYQINTPQSYLYSKASTAFCKKYNNHRIIFLISDSSDEKMEFIRTIQSDLNQNGILYETVNYNPALSSTLELSLSTNQANVIVPSDDTSETLSKILPPLKILAETRPEMQISLFGYPGWQVYSNSHSENYFRLNTSFYTIFYADPTSSDVKSFYSKFNQWYSRELINTFPKYGILGFDTGLFFIQLLSQYGTKFNARINQLNYKGIQTDFHFERVNNWGGFINTNLYIVNYNPDFTITKNHIK